MKKNNAYFWPEWFYNSLPLNEHEKIQSKIIKELNLANSYLWEALNIYDDFFDGQGKSSELPKANNYYRNFLETYYRLNFNPDFYKLFNKIIDKLDAANRQEIKNNHFKIGNGIVILPKKLPSFKDLTSLSKKSLILSAGPIAIYYLLKKSKIEIKAVYNFFRLVLSARQLADDIFDWLDDLKNGSITAANILILKELKKQKINLNIKKDEGFVLRLFIDKTSEKNYKDLKNLCQKSRAALKQIGFTQNCQLAKGLITPIEKNLSKAIYNKNHLIL